MIPYWVLFAVPAFVSFFEKPAQNSFRGERTVFLLTLAFVAVMIGIRYEVGADWETYFGHLHAAGILNLEEVFRASDPGYVLLNWLASRLGGDIRLVNLACGAIFAAGLYSLTRAQPSPWLALAVAVPYLIIVVAMGYSRQAVAIGLAMLGLTALVRSKSTMLSVFWVLAAATFHKSAVLLIPILALTAERGRLWVALWTISATAVGYFLLLADSVNHLVVNYIEVEYQSDGAAIRVAMNAVPAALLLLFRQRFALRYSERRLWMIYSILSLAFIPALFVMPSTAVDRLALYMIPLQLVVLSRVPLVFARTERMLQFLRLAVVLYAAAVMFVWLNYATHAQYWLPYQFYPLL